MQLLDSGRSSRQAGAVSVTDAATNAVANAAVDIMGDLADLQRENSALVAELRRQRRRRTVKRLRRLSFVVVPVVRAAARHSSKNSAKSSAQNSAATSTAGAPTTPTAPEHDRRMQMIILALVIRRLMASPDEPTSALASRPLPTPREVHS